MSEDEEDNQETDERPQVSHFPRTSRIVATLHLTPLTTRRFFRD